MAYAYERNTGRFDSVHVTNGPSLLTNDLKNLLVKHFEETLGNTVLRISTSTKNGVVTAHLQFASEEEATNAVRNGRNLVFVGTSYNLTIKPTSKQPTTQLLKRQYLPPPPPNYLQPARQQNIQPTIQSYFGGNSAGSGSTRTHVPGPAQPLVQRAHTPGPAQPLVQKAPTPGPAQPLVQSAPTPGPAQPLVQSVPTPGPAQPLVQRVHTLGPAQPLIQRATVERSEAPATVPPVIDLDIEKLLQIPRTTLASQIGVEIEEVQEVKEDKPNICVKLEVYNGPPPAIDQTPQDQTSSAGVTTTTTVSSTNSLTSVRVQQQPARLRPSRSLSDILNLDTSHMKVIPTVTAGDALACQFFSGGKHTFPLALMFGRAPGAMIMPINSLMDQIKPGLEINDSTLEATYNLIAKSVVRSLVQQFAKEGMARIARDKAIDSAITERVDKLVDDTSLEIITSVADMEWDAEVEVLIGCEDVMEEIILDTCGNWIRDIAGTEFESATATNDAVKYFYKTIEKEVINENVLIEARHEFYHYLCSEVIEDLLDSTYFTLCVKITVQNFLTTYVDTQDEDHDDEENDLRIEAENRTARYVASLPLPWNVRSIKGNLNQPENIVGTIIESENNNDNIRQDEPTTSPEIKRNDRMSESSTSLISQRGKSPRNREVSPNKPLATTTTVLGSLKRKAVEFVSFFKRPRRDPEAH